jgi:hypothetical protein
LSTLKTNTQSIILSIGDEANEVNMVWVSNIIIDVEDAERTYAILSSDFPIRSLNFLVPLSLE